MNQADLERCREALALAAPHAKTNAERTQGGHLSSGDWPRLDLIDTRTVQYAYLLPSEPSANLRVFPGDTLTQARILYADAGRIEALLRLQQRGWQVSPNMHFGFAARGFAWMHTTARVEDYANYWLAAITRTHELDRHEWPSFLAELFSQRFAGPGDEEVFRRAFDETRRQKASPRPGLWMSKDVSASLSDTETLAGDVDAALREVLDALREPLTTLASSSR